MLKYTNPILFTLFPFSLPIIRRGKYNYRFVGRRVHESWEAVIVCLTDAGYASSASRWRAHSVACTEAVITRRARLPRGMSWWKLPPNMHHSRKWVFLPLSMFHDGITIYTPNLLLNLHVSRVERHNTLARFIYFRNFRSRKVALLLREGLALYGLSHPALLPVLGVSIEDRSAPFLLYPHTGYKNMKRFLVRCKLSSEGPPRALTTQEVVEMALQAAKGVQYLHRKRLVHRDLAARNCV